MVKKALFIILFCASAAGVVAQTGEQEANLKAAFIYSFTRYIDWGAYDDNYTFVIGVLGEDSPVLPPLHEIAKSKTINNKRIEIRIINKISELKDCKIVFISKECPFSLHAVLDHIPKGVLTISESDGYASLGTDFNFVIVNQRLKFEANLKAIASSGLKAGSQLLKLAIIVDQG